jgi:hypothetical protein
MSRNLKVAILCAERERDMMADTDESILMAESQTKPRKRGRFASGAVRLLAILIAAACAFFVTNNWCFVIFPAVLAGLIVDYIVCAIRPWFVMRVSAAVAAGVAVGLLLGVGPDWAFREAFEMAPPDGVHSVRIWRHYLGGPGEHALIIEFTADTASFESLVKAHPPLSDSDRVRRWQDAGGGWDSVLDAFLRIGQTRFVCSSWQEIRPLEQTEVLDLGGSNRGTLALFREPDTGRCVALHVRY